MPTECSAELFDFGTVEGRAVEAAFDAGLVTSDAGALLLGATDRAIGMMDRFAACFHDERRPELIEHEVATLVGQRVFGIALGYEDLNDHDELRHDPMMAVLAGKLEARREDCAPVAGKSTLNRLELSRLEPTRYHKISHNPMAIKRLFVDLFLEAHERAAEQIILDLDATDDPVHGEQEGRFFHGYYDCYCYLPLYVFCGRHLLARQAAAREHRRGGRRGGGGGAHRRADSPSLAAGAHSGARRLGLRARGADGLVRGQRRATFCSGWRTTIGSSPRSRPSLSRPRRRAGVPASRRAASRDFRWMTRRSWSRRRRVVAKAEWTKGEANPRFVVTSLRARRVQGPVSLREGLLRPRRDGEPDQGVPARSLCRSHLDRHHAGQPAAPVVLPRWPMCCCVPCAASGCSHTASPRPPAAPSVSSCSRSARSCASASAASSSRWRQLVRPRETGAAPQSGSQSPPSPAPRRPDTRRRGAIIARQHPQAHRDPENINYKSRPSAPRICLAQPQPQSKSAYTPHNPSVV